MTLGTLISIDGDLNTESHSATMLTLSRTIAQIASCPDIKDKGHVERGCQSAFKTNVFKDKGDVFFMAM